MPSAFIEKYWNVQLTVYLETFTKITCCSETTMIITILSRTHKKYNIYLKIIKICSCCMYGFIEFFSMRWLSICHIKNQDKYRQVYIWNKAK